MHLFLRIFYILYLQLVGAINSDQDCILYLTTNSLHYNTMLFLSTLKSWQHLDFWRQEHANRNWLTDHGYPKYKYNLPMFRFYFSFVLFCWNSAWNIYTHTCRNFISKTSALTNVILTDNHRHSYQDLNLLLCPDLNPAPNIFGMNYNRDCKPGLHNHVERLPRRVPALIASKGGPAPYWYLWINNGMSLRFLWV